ncbi:MAG: VOC family protein [Rhodospirillales bacterium]|nr:MAG: VOC family protein [Rhodospirillales bacterium]
MRAGLRHVGLVVRDIGRMLDFYRKGLGFHPIRQAEERGPFIECLTGLEGADLTTVKLAEEGSERIVLELLCFRHPPSPTAPPHRANDPGFAHLALTVTSLEACLSRLTSLGAKQVNPPLRSPDGKVTALYCRDPEGNLIELVEEAP